MFSLDRHIVCAYTVGMYQREIHIYREREIEEAKENEGREERERKKERKEGKEEEETISTCHYSTSNSANSFPKPSSFSSQKLATLILRHCSISPL